MTPVCSIQARGPSQIGCLIHTDAALFCRDFNGGLFAFRHDMMARPLFEPPRLIKPTETLLCHHDLDKYEVHATREHDGHTTHRFFAPADDSETTRRIDETGSWVKLSDPSQADPCTALDAHPRHPVSQSKLLPERIRPGCRNPHGGSRAVPAASNAR